MPQGYPCINPACDFVFPAAKVPVAGALQCPRCGNVYHFGKGPKPAKPPIPMPPAPIPVASPSKVMPPVAPPIVSSAVIARQRGRGIRLWKAVLLFLGVGTLLVGVPVAGILYYLSQPASARVATRTLKGELYNLNRQPERAFRLTIPATWRQQTELTDDLRRGLNAAIALEADIPVDGSKETRLLWLAVAGADFGVRKPRDAELIQEAIHRLEKCFPDRLQIAEKWDNTRIAGTDALVLEFRAERNSVVWWGQAYALTHHGFGFWVYAAASGGDVAKQVFDYLQETAGLGFEFDTARQGWSEQPLEMDTFHAERAPFLLKARKGMWSRFRAKDADKYGEIALVGKDQEDEKNNLKAAHVLALALPESALDLDAAAAQARQYVEKAQLAIDTKYQFAPVDDSASNGTNMTVGNRPVRVLELQLLFDNQPRKYILLGVVQHPDRIDVLKCECFWEYRHNWRGDFLDLLKSYRSRE